MNVFNDLFSFFKMPSPLVIAAEDLAQAELELLKAESSVEFASAVAHYNRSRIERLKAYLGAEK